MFSDARTFVRVFGLDLRVDPSWLLIAALITWSLCRHIFPNTLPDQSQGTYVAMAIVAMVLFFASLLLHELAHALTARLYGVETKAITLFLFGGVAEMSEEPKRAMDEFRIAVAGPAMSLALAAFFWALASVAALAKFSPIITEVLGYLALINFVLAVFNLLPAFPLDGGRVLRAWLWQRDDDIMRATETAARVGTFFAYGLMGLGALSLFQGGLIGGLWQIMIGLFILAAARGTVETQRTTHLLGNKTVADLMTPSPVVTTPDTTLAELVNQVMLRRRVSFIPVMEGSVLLGHIETSVLSGMDRENWANTQVGDVFINVSGDTTIDLTTPVIDLLSRIAASGQRKFMVIDRGRLVGIITLADLVRYLALVKEVGHIARRKPPSAAEPDGLKR